MAINLLSLLKDQMSDSLVETIAGSIGANSSVARTGINAILPTILGGLASKGATTEGATGLLDMIKGGGYDGSMLSKLPSLLGGGSATNDLMSNGSSLLSSIFGGNQSSILNTIMSVAGMNKNSSSSLMSMLAPMVMSMVGKQVMGSNMGVSGLMDLLKGQKSHISSALPAGMGNILGFADTGKKVAGAVNTAKNTVEETGGGFPWKWIVGALALALLGYFGINSMGGGDKMEAAADTVTSTATDAAGHAADAAGHAAGTMTDAAGSAADMAGNAVDAAGNAMDATGNAVTEKLAEIKEGAKLTVNAAGDLVDEAGNVIRKAGTFTQDASGKITDKAADIASNASDLASFTVSEAGDLVDETGKVILKKGEFTEKDGVYYDKDGNKVGQFLKKVGKAIAGAAGKTADAFKNTFGNMFKKNKGTTHTMQAMTWKGDTHKLANYSQEEMKGLVAALKADPDAKIEVQAYTGDKKGKANKELSQMRAQVVTDMMVTFGVPKSQISAKGMSSKDDEKAAVNKIEILVK